jgi:uncharacterized protein YcbX
MTVIGAVSAITRYPVKSMQGETLDVGAFTATGLEGDRSWGVVNTETGHVLTAKRVAQLLDAAASSGAAGPMIGLPDGTTLEGSGPDIDAALSAWLDAAVALRPAGDAPTAFRMSFNVDDEDQDAFDWSTPAGSFLDLAPVHVLTSAALDAAAAAHPEGAWSVHRFRPTIFIDTGEASGFIENEWVGSTLHMGEVVLEVTMPTVRCSLPTKAQKPRALARDLQIFKSLAASNSQNLGAYANVTTGGVVRVGDAVELRSA